MTDSHCRISSESPEKKQLRVLWCSLWPKKARVKLDRYSATLMFHYLQCYSSNVLCFVLWYTVVMYREWKSGASFRKARPACEFTTSWKHKVKSAHFVSTACLPHFNNKPHKTNRHEWKRTTPWDTVHTTITNTYVKLNTAVSFTDDFNGKPHVSLFLVDRTHDIQAYKCILIQTSEVVRFHLLHFVMPYAL